MAGPLDAPRRSPDPVHLLDGEHDGVPVPGLARALADRGAVVTAKTVPGADHALPVSHPHAVAAAARRLLHTTTAT